MIHYLLAVALVAAVSADPLRYTKEDRPLIVPGGRIINGETVFIESFPYQLSLQYLGSHMCGASIISEHFAVTAGHCVDGLNAASLKLRSGSSYHRSGGKVHSIARVIKHENFHTDRRGIPNNDIALLQVREPFVFDQSQGPIQLFNSAEKSEAGANSVITGWGMTEDNIIPSQLKSVSIPVISKRLCDQAYGRFGGVPEGQICAAFYGVGGKDSCQGDSGGPMAIDNRLAGIVSWGNGCADPDYPGVYTEVAYFRKWIEKHVNGY